MGNLLRVAFMTDKIKTLGVLRSFEDFLAASTLYKKVADLGVENEQIFVYTSPYIKSLEEVGYPKEQAVLILNHLARTKADTYVEAPATKARMN